MTKTNGNLAKSVFGKIVGDVVSIHGGEMPIIGSTLIARIGKENRVKMWLPFDGEKCYRIGIAVINIKRGVIDETSIRFDSFCDQDQETSPVIVYSSKYGPDWEDREPTDTEWYGICDAIDLYLKMFVDNR